MVSLTAPFVTILVEPLTMETRWMESDHPQYPGSGTDGVFGTKTKSASNVSHGVFAAWALISEHKERPRGLNETVRDVLAAVAWR